MKYYGDYHTHTRYSDGHNTVEENVVSAIAKGLSEIAITDHGFRNPMCLKECNIQKQRREVEQCREKYPEIRILHGIEADLMDKDGGIDLTPEIASGFDLIIAGYHSFAMPYLPIEIFRMHLNTYISSITKPSKKTVLRNTDTAIKMIEKNEIDIYPHINHMYTVDIKEVANACAALGVFVEINMKHLNPKLLDSLLLTDAEFIADTDSHYADRVGDFSALEPYLENFDEGRIVNANGRMPVFRSSKKRVLER